jgi:hypothetical protein
MSAPDKPKTPLDKFLEAYAVDLVATPDSEIVEGEDIADIRRRALARLAAAKAAAGPARLARARAERDAAVESRATRPTASAAHAREFLRAAANDSRYTLAARDYQELSDEDALKAYFKLLDLGAVDDSTEK